VNVVKQGEMPVRDVVHLRGRRIWTRHPRPGFVASDCPGRQERQWPRLHGALQRNDGSESSIKDGSFPLKVTTDDWASATFTFTDSKQRTFSSR